MREKVKEKVMMHLVRRVVLKYEKINEGIRKIEGRNKEEIRN